MADRAHSTSRRALLAGLTTSTFLGLPVLAAPLNPDAALLDLERRWRPVSDAYDAAVARVTALEGVGYPEEPDALFVQVGDRDLKLAHNAMPCHDGRSWYFLSDTIAGTALRAPQTRLVDEPFPAGDPLDGGGYVICRRRPWPEAQARADAIVAAWDGWQEACARAQAASGFTAARAEMGRLGKEMLAIEEAIEAAEPVTFTGLVVKARHYLGAIEREDVPDDAIEVLVRDILAMKAAT